MALDIILIVVAVVVLGLLVWLALIFNSLVGARQKVKNSWAQIDVQLKKRADLILNLVEIVKGYAKQERDVFENVAKARAGVMSVTSPAQVIEKSNALAATLRGVYAVAEGYPELKSNQNFLDLQKQLVSIEDGIARARMVYNDVVTIYNTLVLTFPQNVIAPVLGFREMKQLEASEIDRAPVGVKL
ncbi:MAG TPA: LemA family protein [Candidatus Bilamarchaeum sp.]|nr:LemA family protein [Candidatus Bilamarchaeum sp.]